MTSVNPTPNNQNYRIVLRFPDSQLMQSGWLEDEEHLARQSALIDAVYGKGNIVLFGFEPLYRGQTYGSFKFFFNTLYK